MTEIQKNRQQQSGFFNRRLQQNQLLVHSFPAGFSLQVARRDIGAYDFTDSRSNVLRDRAKSPPPNLDIHKPASPPQAHEKMLFVSQISKHPDALDTLGGPFVDLGVYGGPIISDNTQLSSQQKLQKDLYVLSSSVSDTNSTSFNANSSKHYSNNAKKFAAAVSNKSSDGLVKGTSAYSLAMVKKRISAISSTHTGSSYTSWMRGSAYERDDYGMNGDENDESDNESDPFADCAGPTMNLLRRLRQQQGVQLPTLTSSQNEGGWALTGQRVSLTIPSHPAAFLSKRGQDDTQSSISESMSSLAPSNTSNDVQNLVSAKQPSSLPSSPKLKTNTAQQPKVYHAPALLPALYPSSVPTGIATLPLQSAAGIISSHPPSTSMSENASQSLLGVNAPHPQPLMPMSIENSSTTPQGVINYSEWVAHQRQERQANDVWRKKGNDPDSNYSLYRGILYNGLSATTEKIAWLVEQGIEPGLQQHVLQDMLLRPEVALPEYVTLCLFSATQLLKAFPNHQSNNVRNPLTTNEDSRKATVGVRPGTQVFAEPPSSSVSVAGEASISNFKNGDILSARVIIPDNQQDRHEVQHQGGLADDIDNVSHMSHQSLQSLLSDVIDENDIDGMEGNMEDERQQSQKKVQGKKSRHNSLNGNMVAITVGELVAEQEQQRQHRDQHQQQTQQVLMTDSIGGQTGSYENVPSIDNGSIPVAGMNSSTSQWLTDGVQRVVPTQSSLRYLQEVIVHDIAEAILTAFPTYHHQVLKHPNASKTFSAIDLKHQQHLARSLEEEYYRLAKDLAKDMKLQLFDHRDRTWRTLKNESDWQKGVLNAMLYPDNDTKYRVEVMYHLPIEIEAQLKRHLLLYRHNHRHEEHKIESALSLAQAAVSGVLKSMATVSDTENFRDTKEDTEGKRKTKSVAGKLSMSMSTTSLGSSNAIPPMGGVPSASATAILNEHASVLQQHQNDSSSRHLQDSLASLTAALDYRVAHGKRAGNHEHRRHQHRSELEGQKSHHCLDLSKSLTQSSASVLSSHASLGSGYHTHQVTSVAPSHGTSFSMYGGNPLLASQTDYSQIHSQRSTATAPQGGTALRTPPLTVVKAPSILYPQAQHYKVQSMRQKNDDSLPKLQAMAESLEQRLIQTRWG